MQPRSWGYGGRRDSCVHPLGSAGAGDSDTGNSLGLLQGSGMGCWFSGLLWERCSGVGCRGQESSILLPKHLLPIRALPLQTQGIFLVEQIQSLHGKQGSMAEVQKERHKLP